MLATWKPKDCQIYSEWCWRDGSVIKRTGCSSQHPHRNSSSDAPFLSPQIYMYVAYTHSSRGTGTHAHKKFTQIAMSH